MKNASGLSVKITNLIQKYNKKLAIMKEAIIILFL